MRSCNKQTLIILYNMEKQRNKHKSGPLLFLISVLLFIIVGPFALFYTFIRLSLQFKYKSFLVLIGSLFYFLAYSIDQLGNVLCQYLFNDILIKRDGYKFGDPDFTISAVLGINKKRGTLKPLGAWLSRVLNWIDPKHVEKAAEAEKCK